MIYHKPSQDRLRQDREGRDPGEREEVLGIVGRAREEQTLSLIHIVRAFRMESVANRGTLVRTRRVIDQAACLLTSVLLCRPISESRFRPIASRSSWAGFHAKAVGQGRVSNKQSTATADRS